MMRVRVFLSKSVYQLSPFDCNLLALAFYRFIIYLLL